MENLKRCSTCKEHKPLSEFSKNKRQKDGYTNQCRECARYTRINLYFGLTREQFDALYKKQGGCCAICGRHESVFERGLSIDHDHHTGEIRGLLCAFCNHRIIGRFTRGGPLKRAAEYLEGEYTGYTVPSKYTKGYKKKRKRQSVPTL